MKIKNLEVNQPLNLMVGKETITIFPREEVIVDDKLVCKPQLENLKRDGKVQISK